jgi:hypothetical protein
MTERQYNLLVKAFKLDRETSLLNKFKDWALENRIIIERSPPYTPD